MRFLRLAVTLLLVALEKRRERNDGPSAAQGR